MFQVKESIARETLLSAEEGFSTLETEMDATPTEQMSKSLIDEATRRWERKDGKIIGVLILVSR